MQPRRATTHIYTRRAARPQRAGRRAETPPLRVQVPLRTPFAGAAAHAIRRGCGRRRRARKRDCPPLRGGMLGAGVLALLAGLACYLGAAMGIIECE